VRGRELAAANKNSKGAPTAMSSLVAAATMFPMHTFSHGAISTASTRNLGHGGGSSLGADVVGQTLVCRCRSVVAAGRAISGAHDNGGATLQSSIDISGACAFSA